jgi:uncharacterized caspase-like protein
MRPAHTEQQKRRSGSSFLRIAKSPTPDDTFLPSFSGHGYADAEGRLYLFPSDLRAEDDQAITPTSLASAISSDELAEWVECQCRHKTPAILPVLPMRDTVSLGGDAVGTLQ